MNITDDETRFLRQLGLQLRQERLKHNESQKIFAERLGISRQSYGKMEKGAPTIPIGYWLKAAILLGLFENWQELIKPRNTNLFDRLQQEQTERKRASKSERKGL
jgi:transcriptional regulator with XRE-family HTH domain